MLPQVKHVGGFGRLDVFGQSSDCRTVRAPPARRTKGKYGIGGKRHATSGSLASGVHSD